MPHLWFSVYDFSFSYKDADPAFIDSKSFDWANDLETSVDLIRTELQKYIEDKEFVPYFNTPMVGGKNSWKTISLKWWSIEVFKNQNYFPFTTAIINKYPNIVSASFNLLESESAIKAHYGDTNAIYRCHLGLVIPAGLPNCGFRVNDEKRAWENNKWLIFLDANNHEAWNNTPKDRYILSIDVIRDEFIQKKSFICSTVFTSLFLQKRARKYKIIFETKPLLVKILAKALRLIVQLGMYLSNKLRIF